MLFNSTVFVQFLAAFLLLYWLVRGHLGVRNGLVVVASYVFYMAWDWRFSGLLLLSSLVDYAVGLALEAAKDPRRRKQLLWLSVGTNLSILGFFKYYDFFVVSLRDLLRGLGVGMDLSTLDVILPVGISFYTFQTMSYTIDVYRGQMRPTRDWVGFMAYVAFFPQLVAGPIERARHLLPQFATTRRITRTMLEEGVWLCVWGLFKKVVLADNLSPLVGMAYEQPQPQSAMVVLGTVAFGVQILCDFSGYTDIARGVAKLLGFELMVNFRRPYGATNPQEFWRRWHISLSTWLRDYLYIGLGGSRRGRGRTYVNLGLTMLLGGLWHGAAWHYVLWGAWHGMGLMAHRWWTECRGEGRSRGGQWTAAHGAGWLGTMVFVFYGWLLFRAETWQQVVSLTEGLATPGVPDYFGSYLASVFLFTAPLMVAGLWPWLTRRDGCEFRLPGAARAALMGGMILGVLVYWEKAVEPFIYFQF